MKKSQSNQDLENMNEKKRKRTLSICQIFSLPCHVCCKQVQDFKTCVGPYIYCSISCLEIIYLSLLQDIHNKSFDKMEE